MGHFVTVAEMQIVFFFWCLQTVIKKKKIWQNAADGSNVQRKHDPLLISGLLWARRLYCSPHWLASLKLSDDSIDLCGFQLALVCLSASVLNRDPDKKIQSWMPLQVQKNITKVLSVWINNQRRNSSSYEGTSTQNVILTSF